MLKGRVVWEDDMWREHVRTMHDTFSSILSCVGLTGKGKSREKEARLKCYLTRVSV